MSEAKATAQAPKTAKAVLKKLAYSPRKVNLILGLIRGRSAGEALKQLNFSKRRAAGHIHDLLFSAISNAENNNEMDVDRLVVNEAYVGKDMMLKRFRARARGRGARVHRTYSNVTIVLSEKELN